MILFRNHNTWLLFHWGFLLKYVLFLCFLSRLKLRYGLLVFGILLNICRRMLRNLQSHLGNCRLCLCFWANLWLRNILYIIKELCLPKMHVLLIYTFLHQLFHIILLCFVFYIFYIILLLYWMGDNLLWLCKCLESAR